MRLTQFSVTNYRSITKAHKISIQELTVLVGKNNEGKSNLLTALNVAMISVIMHSQEEKGFYSGKRDGAYKWTRDFPVQYQNRKRNTESIFRLDFLLEDEELNDFHNTTGIRGNNNIPIEVRLGKDNKAKIEVPKQGTSSYIRKSKQVTEFISKRIFYNYIPAIRTEDMAVDALQQVIQSELYALKDNSEYMSAQQRVIQLRKKVFNRIANQIEEPLKVFLPNLKKVSIRSDSEENLFRYRRMVDFDVIIDDGLATSIANKGDGIKSLVAMAILKDKKNRHGASIIAIEEPESHLHSGAIHSLVDVINKMSNNSQVIITTHNPLFVQRNKLSANIIVDNGTAHSAKSISEIRTILGVLPSDNLQNARFVVLVEGETDRVVLNKVLPLYSEKIRAALKANILVIKALGGASNLSHELTNLKNLMCKYVVLLDCDQAGKEANKKAIDNGLVEEGEVRFTICNGSKEAELEDCLKPDIYKRAIEDQYKINLDSHEFKGNKKWSERMRCVFSSQGLFWTDPLEKKIKTIVANAIPDRDIDKNKILIAQKTTFIKGLVTGVEKMIEAP